MAIFNSYVELPEGIWTNLGTVYFSCWGSRFVEVPVWVRDGWFWQQVHTNGSGQYVHLIPYMIIDTYIYIIIYIYMYLPTWNVWSLGWLAYILLTVKWISTSHWSRHHLPHHNCSIMYNIVNWNHPENRFILKGFWGHVLICFYNNVQTGAK